MLADDFHLIALFRLLSDHPRAMATLLEQFRTADNVFKNATKADLAMAGLSKPFRPGRRLDSALGREVERDLKWLEAPEHHLIRYQSDLYPALLAQIYDPPCLLFAAGNIAALARQELASSSTASNAPIKASINTPINVAIVGSRSASRYGLQQASSIAGSLATCGVTVVSGLALGIDAAAHEGALETGGVTLAVLGTGCDEIYPRRHRNLAERIRDKGLLVSEFPLGTGVYPGNFPRRNRVVTGMSKATLVIEAALKSGSLISAQLAANEGREVMALPGMVTSKYARGCHKLIKDGASLVEKAEDVLNELGLAGLPAATDEQHKLDALQRRLIESLAREAKPVDLLSEEIDIDISELLVSLIGLEVLGLVYSDGGHYGLAIPPAQARFTTPG